MNRKYFMSIEWHSSEKVTKKDLVKPAELHRTDISSGESDSVIFNTYQFNLGAAPTTADGLTFKAYAVIDRDVDLIGEMTILFD
jgi:hypothetical protein